MEDCLDFMDVFEVVDFKKKIKNVDTFEQTRECIMFSYRERKFVNEMYLLRTLSEISHIKGKNLF